MDDVFPTDRLDPDRSTPTARRHLIFAIVVTTLFMISVDSTIVATILYTLQHDLGTTVNWAGWTITAYAFGRVLMLPISGKLGERYGHRKVFVGSVGLFTLASLLCGLVDNIFLLVLLRAVQAAGGAGFTPSATAIVVEHYGRGRDRAVGLFGSIFPIGAIVGPAFGGLFLTYWNWRGAFFVNVPIGLLIIGLSLRYIPRDRRQPAPRRAGFDLVGPLLMGVSLLAGMFAASSIGEATPPSRWPLFALLSGTAVAAAALFFRHVRRARKPFIEPRLIFSDHFGAVNLINMIYGGMAIGGVALLPLYATNRYGIAPGASGALLIVEGVAAIALSVTTTFLLRRAGYRKPLYIGGGFLVAGMALLASSPHFGVQPYIWLAGAASLLGIANGAISPASRNAGLQLEPDRSSTLAALRSLSLQIGAIPTVAVITAILANSSDPGSAQGWIYAAMALIFLAGLPLISRVPEHRGAW